MESIRERVRRWTIATICRSERMKIEDESKWIEWKRRCILRLALGVWLALAILVTVKFAADHSKGGRYDAWGEAIDSARREAMP